MGNTILNDVAAGVNTATFAGQARPDKGDTDVWSAAIARTGVISGCVVSQHAGTANLTIDVSAGSVLIAGTQVTVPALASIAIATAHATLDRIDVVSVDNSGIPVVTTGAAAGTPNWPAVAAIAAGTAACLGIVYVPAGPSGAVPAYRASATSGPYTGSASLVFTIPASVAVGDLMLVCAFDAGGGFSWTTPTGWTFVRQDAGGIGHHHRIYSKIAVSGDTGGAATATFVYSGSYYITGILIAYSGVDTTTPINAQAGGGASSSSGTEAAPSATSTVVNCVDVEFWSMWIGGNSYSMAFPATSRATVGTSNGQPGGGVAVSDQAQASIGASGSNSATGNSPYWQTTTLVIAPKTALTILNANIVDKREIFGPIRTNGTRLALTRSALDTTPQRRGIFAGLGQTGRPPILYPGRIAARSTFR